jgi:hypothetical protein
MHARHPRALFGPSIPWGYIVADRMRNRGRTLAHSLLVRMTAFILAANYFCFQVEVFEEEYEKNNPLPSSGPTFTCSSENWETFGKTNAPKAFVHSVAIEATLLCLCPAVLGHELPACIPFRTVRNNSPPERRADIS